MQAHEALGEGQGIDEAGAGTSQIDCPGAIKTKPMRHERGARRQQMIRRRGSEQHQPDIAPVDAGCFERYFAGFRPSDTTSLPSAAYSSSIR